MSSSDEEFFDACDEVDSPKSPGSKSLVFTDTNDLEASENVVNPLIGDLSLDHFSESPTQDHVFAQETEPEKNEQVREIQPEKNASSVKDETNINTDEVSLEVSSKTEELLLQDAITNSHEINQDISDKERPEQKITITIENPEETLNNDSPQREIKSGTFENDLSKLVLDDASKIAENEILLSSDRQVMENINMSLSKEIDGRPQHKEMPKTDNENMYPERPTDLPVAKETFLSPIQPTDSTVQKPKRPPPPRPKGPPPQRPSVGPNKQSLKTTGRPGKPYMSAVDDGLLTPNSTVDNITNEFVEALNKTSQQHPVNRSKSVPIPAGKTRSKSNSLSGSINSKEDEILSAVIVKNLDTGETMPLKSAAEHCLNPLAVQIMSRTKEFSFVDESSPLSSGQNSARSSLKQKGNNLSDDDVASIASDDTGITIGGEAEKNVHDRKPGNKKKKIKKFLGKSMIKVKSATHSGVEKAKQKVKQSKKHESLNVSSDEESTEASQSIKVKASQSNKGPYQFSKIRQVQDIAVHVGAVWSMKFSHCGRLLATAGQDNVIWVWVLAEYHSYFSDMRSRYDTRDTETMFGTSHKNEDTHLRSSDDVDGVAHSTDSDEDEAPFRQIPFSSYVGHAADVLDLAWSKNYFVLSSSMDKTVRLWHISRKECLCCFQHIDFVTAISFHPRDDRYFLSGSLDGKLRLWNIPEKKVALWNEISSDTASASGGALITTVNFCENGKFAVCGTYDGRCIFYDTEHLKYHTQIHVRSSRGRNNKGHKITGIESLAADHKILVTSNDSRIRLYDLRDLSMTCKYKGLTNLSSQIKASFSHDQKYIICGSEDKCVYIWPTNVPQDMTKLRRDRNDRWENIKAHNAVVTCAIFAPQPQLLIKREIPLTPEPKETKSHSFLGSKKHKVATSRVLISADFNGEIKVFTTE